MQARDAAYTDDGPLIRLEQVEKSFGATRALDRVSFAVQRGEVVGLVGPNGAGKTTALRVLSGFLRPDGGAVWVDGIDAVARRREAATRIGYLPEGPPLYPDGDLSDEPETTMIAEFVREAALEGVRDELPHSLAVVVEEMTPGKVLTIRAEIFVERDSQKSIVIGKGGSRLKHVGTEARRQIEAMLGEKVHLDLFVKVAKDWQRDPRQLRRLGF
jgi:ABC-type dipeptide/oligopeptide/nickel transport system ATPase component